MAHKKIDFNGIVRELIREDISEVEEILELYWSGDLKNHFLKRIVDYVNQTSEMIDGEYKYYVAANQKEIVGFAGMRKVPPFMLSYTNTGKPIEFYLIGVKYKGRGIGTALRERLIDEAKRMKFTEAILFSAENHKDSWKFHDHSDSKRIAEILAPNGDSGNVWRIEFK